jgi:quercetin dioxygenase-like cupin family protein
MMQMLRSHRIPGVLASAALVIVGTVSVRAAGAPVTQGPPMILNVVTNDMPKTPTARVRVFVGTLDPGDVTFWHVHDAPPIVYVQSGVGTWEFKDGRKAIVGRAGQAVVEPAHVGVRLANRGTTTVRVVMFSVTKPDDPFLRPAR